MNLYQRHSMTRVSVACGILLIASALFSESSFAQRISGNPESRVEVGDLYRFTPSVSGLKKSKLKFSISGKPNWLSFDKSNGQLKGRPGNSAVGLHRNISVRVTDGRSSATLAPFSVEVVREGSSGNDDPGSGPDDDPGDGSGGGSSSSNGPATTVQVGDRYRFKPRVSGFRNSRLRFEVRRKPAWARFDEDTGVLRGSPKSRDVGTYANIIVRATDGRKTSRIGPFSIEVIAEDGSDGTPDPGGDPPPGNSAPTISGTPPSAVLEGSSFEFTPTASDSDGDTLSFSVDGQPAWANFDRNSGRLLGTPRAKDVGVHGNIVITVTDGQSSASLGPFDISVNSRGDASVTLQWTPPTRNTDGTRLRDLAAFRIDWGLAEDGFTNSVTVDNPGLARYVVENLSPGRYMFAVAAVNSSGVASERSNVSRRTVN